jgi:methyl-accepting chemotaxis protein
MERSFIRKKFITGDPVQIRYLALLVASMIAPLLLAGGCFYFLIFKIIAEQPGLPNSAAEDLFPLIMKTNMILILGFPPLFLLILVWGIILSHRFAGPLRRLQRELEEIASTGDYTKRLEVRGKDDIKPIVDAFDRVLKGLCEKRPA